MTERLVTPGDVLAAYLGGSQEGQEWALLDNLDTDEVRDVAKEAIRRLGVLEGCRDADLEMLQQQVGRVGELMDQLDAADACIGRLRTGFGTVLVSGEWLWVQVGGLHPSVPMTEAELAVMEAT